MQLFLRIATLSTLVIFTLVLSYSAARANDSSTLKAALEACISRHLADEKAKPNPRAGQVLDKCRSETRSYLGVLPAEVRPQVRAHLTNVVQQMLDAS